MLQRVWHCCVCCTKGIVFEEEWGVRREENRSSFVRRWCIRGRSVKVRPQYFGAFGWSGLIITCADKTSARCAASCSCPGVCGLLLLVCRLLLMLFFLDFAGVTLALFGHLHKLVACIFFLSLFFVLNGNVYHIARRPHKDDEIAAC